eukprot:1150213-Alexandrium_andersonii.AAC.1
MPSPPPRYNNHYGGRPFPDDQAVDRALASGTVPDQDPNRNVVYAAVLTARLSYAGKVIHADC